MAGVERRVAAAEMFDAVRPDTSMLLRSNLVPMVYLVKSGITFEAARDELIMDAAFRAGVWLPHNCLSGTCRTCITRVLSGIVEHDRERIPYLNIHPVEIEQGYRLLCSAFARTDVELDR